MDNKLVNKEEMGGSTSNTNQKSSNTQTIIVAQQSPKKGPKKSLFDRKADRHKTVMPSFKVETLENRIKQKNDNNTSTNTNINLNANINVNSPMKSLGEDIKEIAPQKFERKGGRSMSLIEKKKMGSNVFKEEMKLKVAIQNVVEETEGLPTMKYKVLSRLGDGSYGTVYLAKNITTKATVALKKINKVKENQVDDLEIKNEIDILKHLDHPNIVKIIEFYFTDKAYYIITDFCSCGELYNQIKNQFNENQLCVLMYQMFSGLCYLHSNNICHRDLKLENILISEIEKDKKTDKDYFWIKIIDFGTAKIFEKNKSEKAVVGSSYYIAPEVLLKKYNEKCDTWSAGVILYMLIVGRAPFDGADDEEIISNIKKGKFNSKHKKLLSASEEAQDLVKKLLEVDVNKRLSSMEALKHPWFKKFDAKSLYKNIEEEKIKMYLNRLLHFQINSKFQQMVLAFIVHNIAECEETKDILKIFRLFNTYDDGKLTRDQLLEGLCVYQDKQEMNKVIDDIFMLLDGANRGFIEYEEFLRACLSKNAVYNDESLAYAFNFFDKANTGKISVDKIKAHFVDSTVSEEVFRSIFNEIDANQDGDIDFKEFKDMMLGL